MIDSFIIRQCDMAIKQGIIAKVIFDMIKAQRVTCNYVEDEKIKELCDAIAQGRVKYPGQ